MIAILQQHLDAMRLALAIAFWLISAGTITHLLDELTQRHPAKADQAIWPLIHSALKTLPIAFWFGPGCICSMMVGFPVPATFLIFAYLLLPEVKSPAILEISAPISVVGFLGFWFVAWLVSVLRSTTK